MKTRKILSLVLAMAMVLGLVTVPAFAESAADEYEVVTISSAADFDAFAAAVNEQTTYQNYNASWNPKLYVKITADIDMSKVTFATAIGSYGNGGGFSGTLDGEGHTLSNYTVSCNWDYGRALFRQAQDITVKNITFDNFKSDAAEATDIKTRPAGIIFASVLGKNNVFDNVTVKNSVLYGDNGLGTLMGYGSGDYSNAFVTNYTFNNCKVENCTIYSESERAAILGEFGRDGDVILTVKGCTFNNNKLIATIDGSITESDLDVWYNHGACAINNTSEGIYHTYEYVSTAIDAVKEGEVIVLAKDVTLDEVNAAKAEGVIFDLNGYKVTLPQYYGTVDNGDGTVTVVCTAAARIGETKYETLAEAIAAVGKGETIIVSDGTHTMPNSVANKNFTIKGVSQNAVIEMLTPVNASGSTIAFENITAKFDNDNYEGLQHSVKVTYTDCIHIGTQFLYAPTVEFNNVQFEMYNGTTEYSVWTYGAEDVTFNNCNFNTNGKAILVYNESTTNDFVANIELAGCEFKSNGTYNDKAAVELGNTPYGKNTYNLSFTNCNADTFVENPKGTPTGSKLWGDKNSMITTNAVNGEIKVTIDEEIVAETPHTPEVGEVVVKKYGNSVSFSDILYINQYFKVEGLEKDYIMAHCGLLSWSDSSITKDDIDSSFDSLLASGKVYKSAEYKYNESVGAYTGRTAGIAPKHYDVIYYILPYVELQNGTRVYGDVDEYSVETYCNNRINNESVDENEKAVYDAFLAYGAAAKAWFIK